MLMQHLDNVHNSGLNDYMNRVPFEVQIITFGYLEVSEKKQCRSVCKSFRLLLEKYYLIFKLEGIYYICTFIISLLTYTLVDSYPGQDFNKQEQDGCPITKIESLTITNELEQLPDISHSDLSYLFSRLTNIRILDYTSR